MGRGNLGRRAGLAAGRGGGFWVEGRGDLLYRFGIMLPTNLFVGLLTVTDFNLFTFGCTFIIWHISGPGRDLWFSKL